MQVGPDWLVGVGLVVIFLCVCVWCGFLGLGLVGWWVSCLGGLVGLLGLGMLVGWVGESDWLDWGELYSWLLGPW